VKHDKSEMPKITTSREMHLESTPSIKLSPMDASNITHTRVSSLFFETTEMMHVAFLKKPDRSVQFFFSG
jgi:hypothetical protein